MFSHSAEFENLLEQSEPLMVSEVIHKAFIEVNEEGAEAAAATGRILGFLFAYVCLAFFYSYHFSFFLHFYTKNHT